MVLENVEIPNKIAIALSGFMIFLGVFFYVVFPPLQTASGIYIVLSLVTLVIYSLSEFQESLIGINLERLGLQFLLGLGVAAGFILLKILVPAFAISTPVVPLVVGAFLTGVILLFFAPVTEELLTRGALLGYVQYVESKGGEITPLQFWTANIIQALFFGVLHLLAYIAGFYNLTGGALATNIAAQSSAFIAAVTFGLVAGYVDTRKEVRSLLPSIISHLLINTTVFLSLSIIGLNIVPAMSLALVANGILFIAPLAKGRIGRRIYNKKKFSVEELSKIIEDYQMKLMPISEIAKQFHSSSEIISRTLKENNIEVSQSKRRKELISLGKIDISKNYFKKGQEPWSKGLTKETDERVMNISKAMKEKPSKLKNRTYEEIHGFERAQELKEIRSKSSKGRKMSVEQRMKLSESAKGRPAHNKIKFSNKQINKMCEMYLDNESPSDIAKVFGHNPITITKILRKNNMPKRPKGYYGFKNKNRVLSDEAKRKIGDNLIRNLKAGKYNLKPNGTEKEMIKLIKDNNLPFNYVGDGKIWFKGETTSFNPDFLSKNPKHIIELYGDFWHGKHNFNKIKESKMYPHIKATMDKDKERIETYSKYGYKTLVIWEHELKNPEEVANKIREFLS